MQKFSRRRAPALLTANIIAHAHAQSKQKSLVATEIGKAKRKNKPKQMRSNPNKKCTFQKKTAFSNKTDIFFNKKATHSAVKTAKKEQWATNQSLSTLQHAFIPCPHT
ncbi:MAG: hypothetical protein ACLUE6_05050 [Acutalibacteraceae bacterium]